MGQETNLNQQYENAVYVSYAWNDESMQLVDSIIPVFAKKGIHIKRDKDEIKYKNSIKDFMDRLALAKCVISIISDKYLRSDNCMYELCMVYSNQDFARRIFPIILPDATRIYNPFGRIEYVKYWEDKYNGLNKSIKRLHELNDAPSIIDELNKYGRIKDHLDRLLGFLKDQKSQPVEQHESEGFSTLIDLIEPIIKEASPLQIEVLLSQDKHPVPPPMKRVFMTLAGNLQEYTISRLRDIQKVLSNALGVVDDWIQILTVKTGSVIAIVELPESVIVNLVFQISNTDPKIFDYVTVEALGIEGVEGVITPKKEIGAPKTFVGHEDAIREFRNILLHPYGIQRILFMLGSGGVGKTTLVRRMLAEVRTNNKAICADEPIDLFSTDYRHIDGIQWKIKDIIESLPELAGKPSPFATWVKGKTDTSENFYDCLKAFCAKNPLVLAFDTFETLDAVTSNWLFKSERGGLQVAGLICVIAGREGDREKEELEGYRMNPLVKSIKISGLSLEQAEEFYQRIENEFSNPLDADLRALGVRSSVPSHEGIKRIWEITQGNPLKLEMAFRWPGNSLSEGRLAELSAEQYEENLMRAVFEWGTLGVFGSQSLPVAQAGFDTLICLAYIVRRFDSQFLQFLIDEKFIRFVSPDATKEDVLNYLRRYFFVKTRGTGEDGLEIIQLHDEMAKLVTKYVWRSLDISGEQRSGLYQSIIRFYDSLIKQASPELAESLQVEQLYYMLKLNRESIGIQRWFELAEFGSENIKKLLPGEIKDYISEYDAETQVKIYGRLAGIEDNANHINQALGHWEEVSKLGKAEGRDDWMVDALVGKFNADSEKNPEKAYRTYLLPAKRLAETKVPEKLATVYYEIGYAYRLMQNISEAVKWYDKALQEYRKRPTDPAREATILNDRGYAYTYLGRWGFTTRDVGDALKIRKSLLQADRERLKNAKDEEKERLQRAVAGAALRTGISHNTLGDFGRYADHLEDALQHYTEALILFREADSNHWQAKALCGLGETHRRLSFEAKKNGDMELCEDHLTKALENMQASLYICQKYQIDNERDTACRRIGRLYHDRALIAIEQHQDKQVIRENLQTAHKHFKEGLKYALDTKDDLEEFENLTEIAFLLDDAIAELGADNMPAEFQNALEDFEKALKKHKNDKPRIYQYSVFENLMRLERAAVTFANGDYSKALKEYLEAYKGLGTTAGYGIARYRQHRDHLKTQIGKLPRNDLKVEWCKKFIETWENIAIPGSKPKRTLADDLPDLVEWCYALINDLDKNI